MTILVIFSLIISILLKILFTFSTTLDIYLFIGVAGLNKLAKCHDFVIAKGSVHVILAMAYMTS